jgi:riboflavin kinase/FMN adenylyltransferase
VVLTFEPHPLSVVAPAKAPLQLMPVDERLHRLAEAGADVAIVARADRDLLSRTAEEFVALIVDRLRPKHIVEGASFGFGRGRSGTPETLRELGPGYGFEVCVVEPVTVEIEGRTEAVSSSLVRKLLAEGRAEAAATGLGRPHAVFGEVVSGAHRGADLGFPTANLAVSGQLVPADGVYAGSARLGLPGQLLDPPYAAAISVGTTPTFTSDSDGSASQIEAHLLDADLSLYGKTIRLEFGKWLRLQRKFDSPAALSEQISRDVEAVRRHAAEARRQHEPTARQVHG